MATVPNIKYKTEYCLYWQEGKYCEKGTHCFFAHGPQELRTIQEAFYSSFFIIQNHQQILTRHTEAGLGPAKPSNYKTIFCKFYAQGQCKLGDRCTYAHERRQKRKKKMSQEYKQEMPTPPQHNWTQTQINQYYHQLYYYQMYQMPQASYHYPLVGFTEVSSEPTFGEKIEERESQETIPLDTDKSESINSGVTIKNLPSTNPNSHGTESPSSLKTQESPKSSSAPEPTTLKDCKQLEFLSCSTEFKQNL